MNFREFWALSPLVVLVFWIGVFPQTFLAPMQADINAVSTTVESAFAAHQWPTKDSVVAAGTLPSPNIAPPQPAAPLAAVAETLEFARVE